MVSHADGGGPDVTTELAKPLVAQRTGSHLNAHAMQFGIGLCVEMDAMEGDAKPLAEVGTELFITV
jgi:hypothetical protein